MARIAAVLVRGTVNVRHDILAALRALKLLRKHACVILEDTPENRGMMRKAKDFIAYGPISPEMEKELAKKRSSSENVFHLNPPRGGFGRKGIKVSYQEGGALGYRAESMDALLKRMV